MTTQKKTTIGGQSIIEGIVMKGPKKSCTVVRRANGELVSKTEPTPSRAPIWEKPIFRGAYTLFTAMKEGMQAINYSASFFEDEEADVPPSRFELWLEKKFGSEGLNKVILSISTVIGLALPTDIVQTCLGCTILGIAFLLLFYRNSAVPTVTKQDAVGLALGIRGSFLEPTTGEIVNWKTHYTLPALLLFIVIGIMAGMFGLGAGWANVPAFNLIMGVPLKVGVGTSKFLLSVTDTAAAWVYLNQGCVIPLMAIPSIMGLMLGSLVGVRLLAHAKPKFVRYMVIVVLFFSGVRALMKGLGW